jgi:hypothetical protein
MMIDGGGSMSIYRFMSIVSVFNWTSCDYS